MSGCHARPPPLASAPQRCSLPTPLSLRHKAGLPGRLAPVCPSLAQWGPLHHTATSQKPCPCAHPQPALTTRCPHRCGTPDCHLPVWAAPPPVKGYPASNISQYPQPKSLGKEVFLPIKSGGHPRLPITLQPIRTTRSLDGALCPASRM